MAMSNKERQAAYRARQKQERLTGNAEGGYRINTMTDSDTYFRLERLAKHYGVTRRALIEDTLKQLERNLINAMDDDQANQYFS